MKISYQEEKKEVLENEVIVFPIFEGEKSSSSQKIVSEFIKDNPKFGKAYESESFYTPSGKFSLIGLGKKEKVTFAVIQNWAASAIKQLALKTEKASIYLPILDTFSPDQVLKSVVLGIELAVFNPFQSFKSEKQTPKLKQVEIITGKNIKGAKAVVKEAQDIAEAINLARTLGDMPSNEMTPTYFLATAKKIAKENDLKLTVIDEAKAKRMGMGAFTEVAKGSDEPSFIIVLEYRGNPRAREKWGLVGKGVTFDSGGISIKSDSGMNEMKYDMCGAAAVLAVAQAVAKLKLKTNFVAICLVTENMPSGKSAKPGDIIKSYSGKTVEVITTDAEGRLLLIDGLTMVQRDFKATKLIDVATLTGAIVVALGDFITGVFTNNKAFAQNLIDAGERAGEKFWLMPMDEEYEGMIKSDFADISNIGHGGSSSRAAGAITGAKFMEQVVEGDRSWVHLDIAGTAWDLKAKPYRNPGATGETVKTLVELIKES